jgi:hypothetical protein
MSFGGSRRENQFDHRHAARAQLEELISNAAPLEGNFFRSVAFQYFHPDDVISGEGPRVYSGRFVPI